MKNPQPKQTVMAIAGRIKELRLHKGITQQKMADSLNISQVAYSKIENGLSNFTIDRLAAIAEVLNVNPIKFFDKDKSVNQLSAKVPIGVLQQYTIALAPAVFTEEARVSRENKEKITDNELGKRIAKKTIIIALHVAEALYNLKQ